MKTLSRSSIRWQRSKGAVVVLIHILIIILYRATMWTTMGESLWYFDRLIFYPILFILQWILLAGQPALHRWLLASILGLMLGTFLLFIFGSLVLDPLKAMYLPRPPRIWIARDYYLIKDLITNGMLGVGVGSGQALCLKHDGDDATWWSVAIPVTLLAYSINALWWYTTKTWPVGM